MNINTAISNPNLTTEQVAETAHCKPNSIRTRLCKTGSFYGIKPVKLPSGRLLWPADAVHRLVTGEGV